MNSGKGVTTPVPAGTFSGCVTVTENIVSLSGAKPLTKTYAPEIGLISADDGLKLSMIIDPLGSDGRPILWIQEAIQLAWPLSGTNFQIESSLDLTNWSLIPQSVQQIDGRNHVTVPNDGGKKAFRLSSP